MRRMASRGFYPPNVRTHGVHILALAKHNPPLLPWPWPALRAWLPTLRGTLHVAVPPDAPTARSCAAAAGSPS
eukprot:5379392-Lingulodinium_polyedra.AAC.1